MIKSTLSLFLFTILALLLWSCHKDTKTVQHAPSLPATPYNYVGTDDKHKAEDHKLVLIAYIGQNWQLHPEVVAPPTNIIITLGRVIFYDKVIINSTSTCYTCHSQGTNAPKAIGEPAAGGASFGHPDIGLGSSGQVIARMKASTYYPELFRQAFGSADITAERMSEAVAEYMAAMSSYSAEALATDPRFADPFK
jgi:cytochrome c peroxidase